MSSNWTPEQIQQHYQQWNQNPANSNQIYSNNQQRAEATAPSYSSTTVPSYSSAVKKKSTFKKISKKPLGIIGAIGSPKGKTTISNKLKKSFVSASVEPAQPVYPANFTAYVARAFESIQPKDKAMMETKLRAIVDHANRTNTMWTIDWEKVVLPNPRTNEDILPMLVQKMPESFLSTSKMKKKVKKSSIPIINSPTVSKKMKITNSNEDLANLSEQQRTEEIKKREQRSQRFDADFNSMQQKMKKKQIYQPNQGRMNFGGNPDAVDWNETTIIGTCAELEKSYLRLTSAPDPSTVRPLIILRKTLELLKKKWKSEQNYTYICDQFKSLRQDLTVQRVKNEFTVLVYETHSRIAIEKGDLGEFNQCSAQLRLLYTQNELPGCEDEFTAYRILYMIHTLNGRDLIELIGSVTRPGPAVQHAFHVRSAISSGNYNQFFQLYHEAPNMGGYLMDHFLERERLKTLLKLTKAYRPTMAIAFIGCMLGFVVPGEEYTKPIGRNVFIWVRNLGIVVENEMIDCKAAVPILTQLVQELGAKGVDIKGQIH